MALAVVGGAVLVGLAWAGTAEWNLSWTIPVIAGRVRQVTGWSLQADRVWLTPRFGVKAQEVYLQPSGGGRLHARSLVARWRWADLARGRLGSHWQALLIHIDPGSWQIRRPPTVALLSAGAILESVSGRVVLRRQEVLVTQIRGHGSTLRFHGAASWRRDGALRGWLRGQIAAPLVRGFGRREGRGAWAPIVLHVGGTVACPALRVEVGGLSFQTAPLKEPS